MRRYIHASIAIFLCACLLISLRTFSVTPLSPKPQKTLSESLPRECLIDLNLLRADILNLTFEVDYAQLEIVVTPSDEVGSFSGDLVTVTLPDFKSIDLHADEPLQKCGSATVTMSIPAPSVRPDASHIFFGVATTLERLDESLDAFALWAGGTNTTILAAIEPHADLPKVEAKAERLGVRLTVVQSDAEYLDRYFALVRFLFQHLESHTKWIGIIDDDTFFPSMASLVSRLSSYNAEEPQYIGALSEDFAQMYFWGFMAYGGGGIFISIPLLRMLNDEKVYDECTAMVDTGDRRIARCIYHYTNTRLTWEPDLHQLDLHGDMAGFYESGRGLPLSLHHWKSWYPVDMVALSAVSSVCGDECVLRRWRLADDWFLVNGFSLIKYSTPPTRDQLKLLTMEKTWGESEYDHMHSGEGFMHSLAPLRPRDEDKVSFRLRSAVRDESQSFVRQFYIREQSVPDFSGRDQVLEVIWRRVS